MIVWMRRHARALAASCGRARASALAQGSVGALVGMAFFAVLREGFETAVFLLAAFRASTNRRAAGVGAPLGVLVAVAIGWGIYRGGVKINLAAFFRVHRARARARRRRPGRRGAAHGARGRLDQRLGRRRPST